jgi:hypothetical protein
VSEGFSGATSGLIRGPQAARATAIANVRARFMMKSIAAGQLGCLFLGLSGQGGSSSLEFYS